MAGLPASKPWNTRPGAGKEVRQVITGGHHRNRLPRAHLGDGQQALAAPVLGA
jgi:hypothetical protein